MITTAICVVIIAFGYIAIIDYTKRPTKIKVKFKEGIGLMVYKTHTGVFYWPYKQKDKKAYLENGASIEEVLKDIWGC